MHGFGQEDRFEAETKRQNFNQAMVMEKGGLPGDFRGFRAEEGEI